jgi:hypothetical protein
MKHGNLSTQLAPLVPPACCCGGVTRLVGLEPAADGGDAADLCTYECTSCGESQTRVFLRTPDVALNAALNRAGIGNGTNGHSVPMLIRSPSTE